MLLYSDSLFIRIHCNWEINTNLSAQTKFNVVLQVHHRPSIATFLSRSTKGFLIISSIHNVSHIFFIIISTFIITICSKSVSFSKNLCFFNYCRPRPIVDNSDSEASN